MMSFLKCLSNRENNGVKGEMKHKVERFTLNFFQGTGTWETSCKQTCPPNQNRGALSYL